MKILLRLKVKDSLYIRLLRNHPFLWLWSGQGISTFGDVFFNLAAMWVVYTQSGSALQTAFIQVIWQLCPIIFGIPAGLLADRWDRRYIMIITNLLSALTLSTLTTTLPAQGRLSPLAIFATIFLLNSLSTFFGPASFALIPQIVERDLLTVASGISTSTRQLATLVGSALAGLVLAATGTSWALIIDALSFLYAAFTLVMARLPPRNTTSSNNKQNILWLYELQGGWRVLNEHPVIRALLWFGVLINVASLLGPLQPTLISQRLHGNAAVYGAIDAMSVIGGIVGGVLAGPLERKVKAGYLMVIGYSVTGICVLGIAASTSFPLTAGLEFISALGITVSNVVSGALQQALIP